MIDDVGIRGRHRDRVSIGVKPGVKIRKRGSAVHGECMQSLATPAAHIPAYVYRIIGCRSTRYNGDGDVVEACRAAESPAPCELPRPGHTRICRDSKCPALVDIAASCPRRWFTRQRIDKGRPGPLVDPERDPLCSTSRPQCQSFCEDGSYGKCVCCLIDSPVCPRAQAQHRTNYRVGIARGEDHVSDAPVAGVV